ncbi:MAG TPA: peptidylprolyl isomerase [Thermoanaerobaculia bacterium]|nr:peptidylprolyl isomerase [Thermoanaerobaculia bacterium]
MKKTTLMIMALALSAAIAGAQDKPAAMPAASQATPAATQASDDPIIVAAGDVSIRRSEFENAIKTLPAEYQQFAQGPGKKQFAEDYLRMKMLAAQGFKDNLQNDAEVQQQLNLMRENLVANAELQKMEKGIKLTDADLQKIYDANNKEYEQVKARHILIAFKGSPAAQPGKKELTEDEAKAKAEELKKKIQAGASFDELAKTESDDKGSAARGGDLGPFSRGQMVEEFEKAAFDAKPGDVIGPVHTQYGFHLIKVDSHETTPFDKVKDTLEKRERQRRLQETLDAMKKNANPTFNEAYFAPPAPKMEAAPAAPTQAKPAAETKKPAPATKKSDKKQ